MLQRHRGHRQHADAVGIDQERILVRAVVGAAVLDDAQAAGRDLIVDAVVEQDHRVRDVLLESLPGEGTVAALAGDHRRDALVLQPPEQPPQFGPEDGVVLQAGKQRFDGIEDDALGADRPDRVIEPDEQPFEIVLARFLDLAAFDAHVVDRELLRLDQLREVEAERRDVAGNLLGVLLERHQHAGLVEMKRAVHQKRERQQRLAGPRPAADQRRPALRQAAARDLVEATNSCQGFRRFATARRAAPIVVAGWFLHTIRFSRAAEPHRARPCVDASTGGRITGRRARRLGSAGTVTPRRYRRCYILDIPANGPGGHVGSARLGCGDQLVDVVGEIAQPHGGGVL